MSAEESAFGTIVRRGLGDGLYAGAVLRVERARAGTRQGDSGLLFEGAWGDALRVGSEREPMTASTIFDLASATKLFTATAVLRLVSLGLLRLDDNVADLITAGRGADARGTNTGSAADPATLSRLRAGLGAIDVAALLTHSSGLHYWHPFYLRRGELFETILADVLEAYPPKDETIYSDINFMLLGRILEITTRSTITDAVGSLTLRPLRLERTSYARPLGSAAATEFGNRIERGMVAGLGLAFSGWRDESRPIRGEPDDGNCHYFFGGAAGHAGIFSDARDLCRLGRLYLKGGRADDVGYLAPGLAEEALRDRGTGRGLGFQLGENYPGGGGGHTGFTGTYLHVNPEAGIVIAILANRLHVAAPKDINPFRRELSRTVLDRFR